jgi:hypothetical protein
VSCIETLAAVKVSIDYPAGSDYDGGHESGLVQLDAPSLVNARKSGNGCVTEPHACVVVVTVTIVGEKNGPWTNDEEYHRGNLVFGSEGFGPETVQPEL